jgi:hypothetical protein
VWDTYEAIVDACANAWRFLIEDPDRIRSIAHRDWVWVNLKRAGIIRSVLSTARKQDWNMLHTLTSTPAPDHRYPAGLIGRFDPSAVT